MSEADASATTYPVVEGMSDEDTTMLHYSIDRLEEYRSPFGSMSGDQGAYHMIKKDGIWTVQCDPWPGKRS